MGKSLIKLALRRMLGHPGLARRLFRNDLHVFVYHEVSEAPSPFCRRYHLNVPPALFEEQVRFISEHYCLITPEQLISGDYKTPAALITFDDGMAGCFRNALPILERYRAPALIFLNMGPIRGELFWSGLVSWLAEHDPLFVERVRRARPGQDSVPPFLLADEDLVTDHLATVDYEEVESRARAWYGEFATEADVAAAGNNPLVTLGNHLYNHCNSRWLSDERLAALYRENERLIARYPRGRPYFAYPFGQPGTCFTEGTTAAVRKLGAELVFSSSDGVVRRGEEWGSGPLDRIAVDDRIHSAADLFGRITWKNRIRRGRR